MDNFKTLIINTLNRTKQDIKQVKNKNIRLLSIEFLGRQITDVCYSKK
jgi:hypothetical protein